MVRLLPLFGAAVAIVSLSAATMAADVLNDVNPMGDLRGSYPEQWGFSDEPDPLDFEIGLRYWYSLGSSQISAFGGNYSSADVSHILEVHARIDDNSTASYAKGQVGFAAIIDGTYSTPEFGGAQTMNGGNIGYAGADFGMMPFGSEAVKFGGFAGYQYLSDNPDMGRATYTTSGGGSSSDTNTTEIHMLKLGAVARAEFGDMFDINAEAAIIPYANLSGTYGAFYQPNFLSGGTLYEQGSAGSIEGMLYGASGEIMFGIAPSENLKLRVGARGYYLTGDATMQFRAREVGTPSNSQTYIGDVTGLEFFRYGALAEITGAF